MINGDGGMSPSPVAGVPIAIVGLAGRFPGDASSPQALWDMVLQKKSAWSEIPEDRMNARAYFHPNPSKHSTFNMKGAHFMKEDVGLFDAPFFSISPNEAKAMDPQQRWLLECTYEALENAGRTLKSIAGTSTGVYVGAAQIDYTALLHKDIEDIPTYQSTGTSANILSNRISYVFDLRGPSITMDTACSSSLAALHTACQSLRAGEIDQAIVGGAHLMLSPATMVAMSMLKLFGEAGRCYTYDSRGTGYGRGEGIVTLLLKPLDAAVRDRDNIRAVIRNTGVNQDGNTSGITFPSCNAQAELIRSVYTAAGLDPAATDYVEAHGTGTAAGDPVEAEALSRVFCKDRSTPLHVGSVKTNIGHLEAASGLAGLVKTIYALEEGVIPPNINFEAPNDSIPLEHWKLKVPTATTPWPICRLRRASISNFGFGGTNVHVILEQHDLDRAQVNGTNNLNHHEDAFAQGINGHSEEVRNPEFNEPKTLTRRLFVFTAHDRTSLQCQMQNIAAYAAQKIDDAAIMERLAYTLCQRRSLFDYREAVSASTPIELSETLSGNTIEPASYSGTPKIGFVFTGQGAQWYAMARELYCYPLFATTMRELDSYVHEFGADWSLLNELHKDSDSSLVDRPFIAQPATTAIQIALVDLLSSWKIRPTAVVGHSSGEIAAAYAAGALSARSSMLIAYQRGALAETLNVKKPERPGRMLAVGASPATVRPMFKRLGSAQVVMACVNGPSLITASGDERGIARLQSLTESEKLLNRRLKVDIAYHSHHMKDISSEYLEAIQHIDPTQSKEVEFHSSVRGHRVDTQTLEAKYWVENMTSPVLFSDAIESMCTVGTASSPDVLIEIGPHSTLERPIRDIMRSKSRKVQYFSTLLRGHDASTTALDLASALFVLGCDLDFAAINLDAGKYLAVLPDLPSYSFNHTKQYWHESRLSINQRLRRFRRSDILGSLTDDYNDLEPRWRNLLRLPDVPWLSHHRVQGSTIFPLTGYLVMAIEAAFQHATLQSLPLTASSQYRLREVTVSRSMVLEENTPTEVSLVMRAQRDGTHTTSKDWHNFSIFSWTHDGGWVQHCQGLISIKTGPEPQTYQYEATKSLEKALDPVEIYNRFSRAGLEFGPAFRNITASSARQGFSMGTVTIPNTVKMMPHEVESIFLIHPGTFDACFQMIDAAASGGDLSHGDLHVPTFVKDISICHALPREPGSKLMVIASAGQAFSSFDPDIRGSFSVLDSDHTRLIEVDGLVVSKLPSNDVKTQQTGERGLCFRLAWEPSVDLMKPEQYPDVFCRSLTVSGSISQAEALEKAALMYIHSAVGCLSTEQVDRLQPHLHQFYGLLSVWLEQGKQGALPLPKAHWLDCTDSEREDFLDNLQSSDDSGRLVCRIGQNLPAILRGEVDPLSIMLQDNLLSAYYKGLTILDRGNEIAASYVSNLAYLNPHMRIIEVGAGTGAASIPMIRALGQSFAHYDFTDISTGFFEAAKLDLAHEADRISYRKLDIEQDLTAQGFEKESYDLIIASNVLHATRNITRTLHSVRSLLRPGGKAVIGEITAQSLSQAIIFGTLPGWWFGEEPERKDKPFLSEAQWDHALRQAGFSGLDSHVQINQDGPSLGSVLLATAIPEQMPNISEFSIALPNHVQQEGKFVQTLSNLIERKYHRQIAVEQLFQVDLEDKYAIVVALEDTTWLDLDAKGLQKMQNIFRSARGILWVVRGASSQNPIANMVFGLARSMRPENAGLTFSTLDLDADSQLPDVEVAETILRVVEMVFGVDRPNFTTDVEFAEINGILHVPRVIGDKAKDDFVVHETDPPLSEPQLFNQQGRPLKLRLGQTGLLDTIHFIDDVNLRLPVADDEVEIKIHAIGMNFKDIMMSLGQIPFYHDLGLECSGVVSDTGSSVSDVSVGDRVCAMVQGAYASFVRVNSALVARIPPNMPFSDAASIPVVFCTAQYALFEMGRLCKGESVLIHAAAGGVGQAAIMLAQRAEADVYVTVGSTEKRELLINRYGIAEDHIFSSRDTSFANQLMSKTKKGRGVDVVLNSTAGEILHQSWQCLAPLGRFVEIGKRDIMLNANLEMEKFADSVSFMSVDLGVLLEARPQSLKRLLTEMVELYQQMEIRPVTPITTLPMSSISQAMRMMQGGKHMGKVVILADDNDIVQATPAPSPKAISNTNGSYLITGGTGGLGRSITRWLSREGARNIILVSRSGMTQKNVEELVEELKTRDVNVAVKKCDITSAEQVQRTIDECKLTMPPIKGVIHGAMALRDALFDKISFEDWTMNIAPRVCGTWNLHNCLLSTPLEFFVVLGSGCGITGNPGQTAYAASNTFLDSFIAYRQGLGLPASAIDIGIVDSVGYVAENIELRKEIEAAAHDRLTEAELLTLIKAVIYNPSSAEYRQTITGCKLIPDKPLTIWATDPKFSHVLHTMQMQAPTIDRSSSGAGGSGVSIRQLLKASSSIESATELIMTALTVKLSGLLAMPAEEIDSKKPIVAYGLDSLVAVEFRNWITVDLEANVPLMELMNSPSIEQLAIKLAAKSKLVEKVKPDETVACSENITEVQLGAQ